MGESNKEQKVNEITETKEFIENHHTNLTL